MVSSFLDQTLDDIQQVTLIEAGFHDVGVCTRGDATFAVFARIEAGDQDDRGLRDLLGPADLRGEFKPIQPRHFDV